MRSIFFLYVHTTSLTQQLCNHSLRARTHFRNSKSVITIIRGCSETAQSTAVPALWYFGFLFSPTWSRLYIRFFDARQGAWQDRRDRYAAGYTAARIDNRVMSWSQFLLLSRNNFQAITCFICFIIDTLIILKNDNLCPDFISPLTFGRNAANVLRFYIYSIYIYIYTQNVAETCLLLLIKAISRFQRFCLFRRKMF